MSMFRKLRAAVGAVAALMLLSGGLSVASASPAAAYAGYCNTALTVRHYVEHTYATELPSYGRNIDCSMSRGANGSHVKALQIALNKCYGQSLKVDGDFGGATEAALEYAQRKEGIGVDGEYGKESRTHLRWYWRTGEFCSRYTTG